MGNDTATLPDRKQSEQQVALEIREILAKRFPGHTVETGKSLLYKIAIDPSGRLSHEDGSDPMRGQNAFQTDILIRKDSTPLVVIELKSGRFSSHDIITYAVKATRHKQIYPYLRYGFVVAGLDGLGRRFVAHNEGFDFAMALPDRAAVQNDLVALVGRQITSAERLCGVMLSERLKIRRYEETVEIDRILP